MKNSRQCSEYSCTVPLYEKSAKPSQKVLPDGYVVFYMNGCGACEKLRKEVGGFDDRNDVYFIDSEEFREYIYEGYKMPMVKYYPSFFQVMNGRYTSSDQSPSIIDIAKTRLKY